MQIMDIKIKKLFLTFQKQTIGCMQSEKIVRFPSKINERKKHWAEPILIGGINIKIFRPHTK